VKRFLAGLAAALYVACVLPGEPSGAERIEFRLDSPLPYRVPLAGTVEPAITITAGGQALSNPHYRLESLDGGVLRVDATGRGLEGLARGMASVRVIYQTATSAPDTVFPFQVVVSRIAVGSPVTSLTRLGATTPLNATAYDAQDAAVPNVAFTWSSADPQVATVNDTGLVRAVDEGTVAITAEADSVKGLASITVTQVAAQVRLAPELDTLRTVGRSTRFLAVAFDDAGGVLRTAKPRWNSSNESVARVDSAGLATATGAGTARIIAKVGDAADTATLVVAQVIRFLVVTPGFDTLTAIADTARVVALAFDSLNFPVPNPSVAWATSDAAVATVDQAGLVQAAQNGVVLVTASAGGQSAFATVVVRQEVATARIVQDDVALTGAGDTVRLNATGFDRNGFVVDGAALTWRSRNVFVATVDAAGLVTAWADGRAGITATPVNGGQSDTATVTVTGAPQAVIAFQSPQGIEVMGADGSGRRVLITGAGQPAWSPDGARLAFIRGDCAIHAANTDGSDERRVSDGNSALCDGNPDSSPDGTKFAFERWGPVDISVYIANADGSNSRWLGGVGGFQWLHPTWSPDGAKLAIEAYDGPYWIAVVNADGTGFHVISPNDGETYGAPDWSPDGSQLAFVRGSDIWLMNPDGSARTNLTSSTGLVGTADPAWSPDGAQIVFVGWATDNSYGDLYVINRDGTGLRQVTSAPDTPKRYPAWRPATPPSGSPGVTGGRARPER